MCWTPPPERSGCHWLIEAYRRQWRARPLTLGLGDGPNDAPLLDVMDYAVVVKGLNREGVHLRNDDPQRVYRSQNEGPDGWREGMDYSFPLLSRVAGANTVRPDCWRNKAVVGQRLQLLKIIVAVFLRATDPH